MLGIHRLIIHPVACIELCIALPGPTYIRRYGHSADPIEHLRRRRGWRDADISLTTLPSTKKCHCPMAVSEYQRFAILEPPETVNQHSPLPRALFGKEQAFEPSSGGAPGLEPGRHDLGRVDDQAISAVEII